MENAATPDAPLKDSGQPLRFWLLLMAWAALLPALAFSAVSLWRSAELERDALLRQSDLQAQQVAQLLERRVQHLTQSLEALARSQAGQEGRWPDLYQQASALTGTHPDLRAISVVSPVDEVVFVTSLPYGSQTFAPNAIDLLKESQQTGRANLSGLFTTPISDRKLVTLTVPVRRVDGQMYAIRGVIWTQTLNEALGAVDLPSDGLLSLADRQGQVIARSRDADRFLGRQVSPGFLKVIQSRESQRFESTTLDGFSVSARAVPLHHGDWTLALAVPQAQLQAPWTRMAWQLAGLLVVSLGLAALLSAGLSRWLLTHLRPVTDGPTARQGDVGATVRRSVREFQAHAHELAQCRASLAAEQASCAEHQRLQLDHRRWYESAHWGDVIFRPSGDIVHMNPHLRERLGIGAEAAGLGWERFLPAASLAAFRMECAQLTSEAHADLDLTLSRSDGSGFDAWLSLRAVDVDADGQVSTLRALVADISERKRVERLLLQRLGDAKPAEGDPDRLNSAPT